MPGTNSKRGNNMVKIVYKKKTKFMYFVEVDSNLFYIFSSKNHDLLGYITFFKPWKKYVFNPESAKYVFDAECLKTIIDFIEELK